MAAALLGAAIPLAPAQMAAAAGELQSGVVAWGGNDLGQLGVEPELLLEGGFFGPEGCLRHPLGYNRHVACSRTPVAVPGLSEVVAVEAEDEGHSVALLRNGTVTEWGGEEPGGATPRAVAGLTTVKAISRGWWGSIALLRDGTVMEWTPSAAPAPVSGLSEVASIAPHGDRLAVLRDGTVVEWGGAQPKSVRGLSHVRAVTTGSFCTVALLWDGGVVASGYNGSGCLGNPEYKTIHEFVPVVGISNAVAIAVGGPNESNRGYALLRDGSVMEWGGGQSVVPHRMAGLEHVVAIAVARQGPLGLALLRDGTVMSWLFASGFGPGAEGELGDGTSSTLPPVQVSSISNAIAIAAAGHHGSAEDRDVWGMAAWSADASARSEPEPPRSEPEPPLTPNPSPLQGPPFSNLAPPSPVAVPEDGRSITARGGLELQRPGRERHTHRHISNRCFGRGHRRSRSTCVPVKRPRPGGRPRRSRP